MLVQQMNKLGISSDVLQVLGFASIFASIATWRTAKGSLPSRRDGPPCADRDVHGRVHGTGPVKPPARMCRASAPP